MAQVNGLDDEVHMHHAVHRRLGLDRADVRAVLGDDGGEFLEQTGAVIADDDQAHRIRGGLGRVLGIVRGAGGPLHIDAAVGLIEQVLHVGTTAGVDRDALAAGDVADDLLAADGVATSRAVDQQIVLAFNLQRLRALAEEDALDGLRHVAERVADGARLGLLVIGGQRAAGLQLVEHLARGVFAEADAGEQIFFAAQAVLVRDAVEVGGLELVQRHLVFAGLALQQLVADLHGARALVFIQPVLDLVARAAALGKAQPVTRGRVAGLRGDLHNVAVAQLEA